MLSWKDICVEQSLGPAEPGHVQFCEVGAKRNKFLKCKQLSNDHFIAWGTSRFQLQYQLLGGG